MHSYFSINTIMGCDCDSILVGPTMVPSLTDLFGGRLSLQVFHSAAGSAINTCTAAAAAGATGSTLLFAAGDDGVVRTWDLRQPKYVLLRAHAPPPQSSTRDHACLRRRTAPFNRQPRELFGGFHGAQATKLHYVPANGTPRYTQSWCPPALHIVSDPCRATATPNNNNTTNTRSTQQELDQTQCGSQLPMVLASCGSAPSHSSTFPWLPCVAQTANLFAALARACLALNLH